MTNVTIFGTGNMGSAIAGVLTAGGADVQHINTTSVDTSVEGDIVVLAVPFSALDQIVDAHADEFAGKIVVDITNPVDFQTFALAVPADSSAAVGLAAKLPESRVLKAFNTSFAATLATKTVGGATTTILIAGDDDAAKATLANLVTGAGLDAIDAGPLARARELEALGYLQLTLAIGEKIGWTGGVSVVK